MRGWGYGRAFLDAALRGLPSSVSPPSSCVLLSSTSPITLRYLGER